MSLDAIRARLGSVPPAKLNGLPRSVQRLLEEDLPKLIRVAEAAKLFERALHDFPARISGHAELAEALTALESPCPLT